MQKLLIENSDTHSAHRLHYPDHKVIRIVRAWILSQDEKTGVIKRTPVRIQITLYYPAPLSLSEDALFLDQDDYQSKLDALLDEPNIQVVMLNYIP